MNPEARAEMVAHAERALRRGELSEALSLYETLCRRFPQDPGLTNKLSTVREMLQPEELQALRPPAHHVFGWAPERKSIRRFFWPHRSPTG